jgi:hypothetical protein
MNFIEDLRPASVLDVGAGMGVYGLLMRNALEGLNLLEFSPHAVTLRPREQWKIRIDGIEGYANYLTPVHGYAYSNMTVGDARELLPRCGTGSYELVLAIDILEHFSEEEGLAFLGDVARVTSRAALVSTPKWFIEQNVAGNPLEDHRSLWSDSALASAGFDIVLPNRESWVAVMRKPVPAGSAVAG